MTKKLLFIFVLLSMPYVLLSCSDNDDEIEFDENDPPENDPNEVEDIDLAHLYEVVANLFDVEYSDLSINGDQDTYTFAYGDVLTPSAPTVYTICAETSEEARGWFLNHCVPSTMIDSLSESKGNIVVDFNAYGSLVYNEANTADIFGSIEVNLSSIPTVTRINIIPRDLLPNNDGTSPCFEGSIVYDTDYQVYYLCVRTVGCDGDAGFLISFDDVWADEKKYKDDKDVFSYYKDHWKKFRIHDGAEKDAWGALHAFYSFTQGNDYYGKNGNKFKETIMNIRESVRSNSNVYNGTAWLENATAMKALFGEVAPARYDAKSRAEKKTWWARETYRVYQTYIYVGQNKETKNGVTSFPYYEKVVRNNKKVHKEDDCIKSSHSVKIDASGFKNRFKLIYDAFSAAHQE